MWICMGCVKLRPSHCTTDDDDRPSPHPACFGRCYASPRAGDPPPPGEDKQKPAPSLRWRVFSVLHGEDDARAVVEAVAVLFGEIVDALAAGDFTFGQQSLTDRV